MQLWGEPVVADSLGGPRDLVMAGDNFLRVRSTGRDGSQDVREMPIYSQLF